MKIMKIQKAAALAAMVGLLLPPPAQAADAPVGAPSDIALRDGGVFVGQYVDAQGNALAGADVSVVVGGKAVAAAKTDKHGVFAVKGLEKGQYDIVAMGRKATFRCWDGKTAPPNARNGALIVTGDEVVNGQLRNMLANPWIVGGIVAAAVAIPVAIHNADNGSPASP
ncbi:hypothetical protein Pla123a_46300 [Posidoniimonas polymericola]|uniref:Carboxypeptidase regulatory-like domain-containing protein n=1 Tax=Posidoniimonas polymericola TaxID=2528002 RepID=A0A5C5XZ29_9BACT|nr:carboxypeptidase-like regulatory domain-containing protein [Posidoniimonas polymericola]TWT66742.1 hypothetical protein Pla123a_46300 [Posidoniimonas polymericola]